MNRRDIIKTVGVLVGGVVVGADGFLTSCTNKPSETNLVLSKAQVKLVEELAEVIIPRTEEMPGAKDIQIGQFINVIVSDYYNNEELDVFVNGLTIIEDDGYVNMTDSQRTSYIENLESQAQRYLANNETKVGGDHEDKVIPPPYLMIKQLTVWGFLTSEEIAKSGFNYLPIPGKYEKCVEVTEGIKPMY